MLESILNGNGDMCQKCYNKRIMSQLHSAIGSFPFQWEGQFLTTNNLK